MPQYIKQNKPVRILVPGNKIIEEHFGKASTEHSDYSLAHMIAPPGWSEPAQKPVFDELTIMIRGKMQITTDEDTVTLEAGESFLSPKNRLVQYANPFEEESEYWAVCIPAFTPEGARRLEENQQ